MISERRGSWQEFGGGMAAMTGVILLLFGPAVGLVQWLVQKENLWLAVMAAAVTVWVGGLVGFLPMVIWGGRNPTAGIYACFGGAAARLGLCIMGVIGWVAGARLDIATVGLSVVVFYLPTLAIEAGLMARWLWKQDFRTDRTGGKSNTGTEAKG